MLRASEPARPVPYSLQFKVFTGVVFGNIAIWFLLYAFISRPALQESYEMQVERGSQDSRFSKFRIDFANALVIYVGGFFVVRAIHFVPAISRRAAHWNSASTGSTGWFSKLFMGDGIMYLFVIASILLCMTGMHNSNVDSSLVLMLLGIHGAFVGLLGLLHMAWHRHLMVEALMQRSSQRVAAPPDTINSLETRPYDEHVFGDGEGRLFPGECPICLGSWEASDSIKITPCQHAFHEECIESWLKSARTCALCRQDLVEAVKRSGSVGPSDSPHYAAALNVRPPLQVP